MPSAKPLVDLERDKSIKYRYAITEFFVIINGKNEPLPLERIQNFSIEHYFEHATFPIFKLNCMFESDRWYNIIKNKKSVKFKIRIQSYYKYEDTGKSSLMKDIINDTFCFFPDDGDENLEIDKDREVDKNKPDDEKKKGNYDDLSNITENVELFLFKDSYINGLRQTVNYVLTGVNLQTAITYLLSKANVNKVLMSPLDNKTNYGTLVLPPQSIDKQLRYLNNNYGLHKNGTMIYFGLLHSYILNFKAGCTAWYKKEWTDTVMMVLGKLNPANAISGCIQKQKETKNYYVVSMQNIMINNNSVSQNVITGTDATIIDMQNASSQKAATDVSVVGRKNDYVVFNNSSNQYASSIYTAQVNANTIVITCVLNDIDLEAFNPNKNFTFVFENPDYIKKYKGSYRLTYAAYNFKGSVNDFMVNAVLTFKKVDK